MTDLTLCQTLHLFRGAIRLLDRHVALLDRCSRELFGRPYAPDRQQLARRILAAAGSDSASMVCSSFVRLELTADGVERLTAGARSYYAGYALRSIRCRGVSIACQPPLDGYPTTAREANLLALRRMALCAGGDVGVQVGPDGCYRTVEGSPLAVVCGRTVWLAPECTPYAVVPPPVGLAGEPLRGHRFDPPRSVEYTLLAEAVRAAGLVLEERSFGPGEQRRFDELFWLDHRGITALSHLDGRPLMALTAERVADALEKLFHA